MRLLTSAIVIATLCLGACADRSATATVMSDAPKHGDPAPVPPVVRQAERGEVRATTAQEQAVIGHHSATVGADTKQSLASRDERIMREESAVDADGTVRRVDLVKRTGSKYPLIRIEETWQGKPDVQGSRRVRRVEMIADHVLAKLAPGVDAERLAPLLADAGMQVRRLRPGADLALISFDSAKSETMAAVIARLQGAAGLVRYAEPDYLVRTNATPNDPTFAQQWGLHNTGQTGGTSDADIDAPEAWDLATGSRTVKVGVIDTGIDYAHPDLAANIWTNPGEDGTDAQGRNKRTNGLDDDNNGYIDDWRGWNFFADTNDASDDNFHGTHVAGTIGAVGNNGVGVTGVCWQVSLVPLKFLGAYGEGPTSDAVDAVLYATRIGVRLTSNSWGGPGFSQALKDAIDAAGNAGILFVAAAGNDSWDIDTYNPSYPASYDSPGIISVAATDHADQLAWFSNTGVVSVDLAAPGVAIRSTFPTTITTGMDYYGFPNTSYESIGGTSMATPHVAGAAALVWSYRASLTMAQVRDRIVLRADRLAALTGKCVSAGRLNLRSVLDDAWQTRPPRLSVTSTAMTDSEGNNDGFANPGEIISLRPTVWNLGDATANGATIELSAASGATVLTTGQQVIGTLAAPSGVVGPAFRLSLAGSLVDEQTIACTFTMRATGAPTTTTVHQVIVTVKPPQVETAITWVPGAVKAHPSLNQTYLIDETNSMLLAVDTQSGRTVKRVRLAADITSPYSPASWMEISPTGDRLFVALRDPRMIQVFSLPSLTPQAVFPLALAPSSVAWGVGERLFIGYGEPDGLSYPVGILNAVTGSLIGEITEGYNDFYGGVVVRRNAAGTRLFLAETGLLTEGGPAYVREYDITSAQPSEVDRHPYAQAYLRDFLVDETQRRIYTVCGGIYAVQVTDMDTGAYNRLWRLTQYGGALAMRPDGSSVYGGSEGPYDSTITRFRRSDGLARDAFLVSTNHGSSGLLPRGMDITTNGRLLFTKEGGGGSGFGVGIIGRGSMALEVYPTARIAATPATGAAPLAVTFSGAASSDPDGSAIVSYQWDFGDGTSGSGAAVAHTYATYGAFSATLTVTDVEGLTDMARTTIQVGAASGPTRIQPGGGGAERFGAPLMLSGDTAIIGTTGVTGSAPAAYLYARSGSTWVQQARVTSNDPELTSYFGYAVAIDEAQTTAVVGAPHQGYWAGAACVFTRSGSTWTRQAVLTAAPYVSNEFGRAVAVSGDTIAVAAPQGDEAAVYIFRRSGSTWNQEARLLKNPSDQSGIEAALALTGDTLAVAYPQTEFGTRGVFIYTRTGTVWTQRTRLVSPVNPNVWGYGSSVAFGVSGGTTTLVVGAPYEYGPVPNQLVGCVYAYTGSGATWTLQGRLLANDLTNAQRFGTSVSISGDDLVIGAPNNANASGAAYLFRRSGGVWSQANRWVHPTVENGAQYGMWVGTSAGRAMIGAPTEGNDDKGAAYVESLTSSGDTQPPVVVITSPSTASSMTQIGATVSLAGTASDNVGVLSVRYVLSGATVGDGMAVGSATWATAAFQVNPGTTVITVVANDTVQSASDTITIVRNSPPVAISASTTVAEDGQVAITLGASDVDGDPLSWRIVSGPLSGSLTGSGNTRIYRPTLNFNGSDNFTFVANDGFSDSQPATVSITVTPVEDLPTALKPGLLAQFYDYTTGLSVIPDLTGRTPEVTRTDAQIAYASVSTAWSGLPSTMADTFASRHSGWLKIDTAGAYTLFISSDDGSRVYLDGALLINNDGLHGMQERSATVTLTAGYHHLKVEFFEQGGGAGLQFNWSGPAIAKQLVPASALWQEDPAPPYVAGLLAEFFDYTTALSVIPDLTGRLPEVSRTDVQIAYASVSTAWSGLPGSMVDTFASRHSGWLKIDTAGTYTVFVSSDDGSRVYLDGALVIDNDGLHGMQERSATLTLAAGYHPLRVEFFENGGGAGLQFSWSGPGIAKQLVPTTALWRLPAAVAGLPAPWTSTDVGAVGLAGSATGDGDDFTILGGGADIWGNADALQFVHRPLTTDGELIARVVSLSNTNAWAKAGVMVRSSTAADSIHGMMVITPANGAAFQYRSVTGGASNNATSAGRTAPYWVRIVRSGSSVSGWISPDGIAWSQVGSTVVLPLGATPIIGLPVTAHDNAVRTTAVFDQVVFVPAAGG